MQFYNIRDILCAYPLYLIMKSIEVKKKLRSHFLTQKVGKLKSCIKIN